MRETAADKIIDLFKSNLAGLTTKPKRLGVQKITYQIEIFIGGRMLCRAKYLYLDRHGNNKDILSSITFTHLGNLKLQGEVIDIVLYVDNQIQHAARYLCTGQFKLGTTHTISLEPTERESN